MKRNDADAQAETGRPVARRAFLRGAMTVGLAGGSALAGAGAETLRPGGSVHPSSTHVPQANRWPTI